VKKSLIAVALVASLSAVAVACNNDEATPEPTTAAEAVESLAAEAEATVEAVESMAAEAEEGAEEAVESMAAEAEEGAEEAVESVAAEE
jgi:hypothetical protein